MRVARLVGLSQDGRSVIVATESGEELAIAADDRLRAALRGDRPRLGQLEIQMESALTPREIQTRIRSGASVEDVARVAGVPVERVERFAAPVIAEREHVASLAMTSSVRRRGETSAHRNLRTVLHERLESRGVDLSTLEWDSFRLADGRWGVTAAYASGEAERRAEFLYDLTGRFSVAGNDDARWVLGEQSPARGPQPGRRRPEGGDPADAEPTLDLSDELALVRAVQEPPSTDDQPLAAVHALHPVPSEVEPIDEPEPVEDEAAEASDTAEAEAEPAEETGGLEMLDAMLDGPEDDEPEERADSGPSDAAAVPETSLPVVPAAWEPSIVMDYPVEPEADTDAEGDGTDDADEDTPDVDRPGEPVPALADHFEDHDELVEERVEAEREAEAQVAEPAESDEAEEAEATAPEPAAKPARRKRASVPSWDEIMFGGPKA